MTFVSFGLFRGFFACMETKRGIDKLVFCYDFDWFRLYSRDQRQSRLKTFDFFQRLKRMLWVLFQSIVFRSSYVQVEDFVK